MNTIINLISIHFKNDIQGITLLPLSLCLKTSSINTIKNCIYKNRLGTYYKNSINLVFGKKAQSVISSLSNLYFNNKINEYNFFDIIEGFFIEDFDKYCNITNKGNNKVTKFVDNATTSMFIDSITELKTQKIKKSLENIIADFNLKVYKSVFIVLPTVPNLVIDFGKIFNKRFVL